VIAVDGPAASGKGTIARRLARHFGFPHLDTGAIYRAVALRVPDGDPGAAVAAAAAFDPAWIDLPGLRDESVGQVASRVAAIPEVRAALLAFQRRFAATPPGAVLDGRDIGTVVWPAAEAKLFVTAHVEVRAGRRARELRARGDDVIYRDVLQDLIARDARDAERAVAPLTAASDALMLDTSRLDAERAFVAALAFTSGRIA
jgi:cytidylate kinase